MNRTSDSGDKRLKSRLRSVRNTLEGKQICLVAHDQHMHVYVGPEVEKALVEVWGEWKVDDKERLGIHRGKTNGEGVKKLPFQSEYQETGGSWLDLKE